jgi:hypothetical protein
MSKRKTFPRKGQHGWVLHQKQIFKRLDQIVDLPLPPAARKVLLPFITTAGTRTASRTRGSRDTLNTRPFP